MSGAVSEERPRRSATLSAPEPEALAARIRATVELTDRRGYGVDLAKFSRLLYGGPASPAEIARAIEGVPELSVVEGLVIHNDRNGEHAGMLSRQSTHARHAVRAEALAFDFAGRLVSTCPLVHTVTLTGSMASGGFDPGDDVDLNIVAAKGAKYTVYLWALALSAVTSLRNRKKPTDEMSPIPGLPKIICINVVWEEGQVRPLTRQDKWIAYELLVHRPILGADAWRGVLKDNPWMMSHFPQVFDVGFFPGDAPEALELSRKRRTGRRWFAFLGRHPHALAAVEALSRAAVIAIHRVVSLSRGHNPEAREREAFVNLVKRPYSVYDVPGKEAPVPPEALRARVQVAPADP